MKKALLIIPILTLTLAGCGISTKDGRTNPPPSTIGDWSEYSPETDDEKGAWKSDSAWGNPPKKDPEVTSSSLPDLRNEQWVPELSRPRFATPANAEFKAPPTVRPEEAVEVNRVVETSSLKSPMPTTPALMESPGVETLPPVKPSTPVVRPARVLPTIVQATAPPAPPKAVTANKDIDLPESAPATDVAVSPEDLVSQAVDRQVNSRVPVPGENASATSEPLLPGVPEQQAVQDSQEAIEMIVAPLLEPDSRIRSPWGDHVLSPALRRDLDAAVLEAVSSGSSAYAASDGDTKFWVERKGSRGSCEVFEVMQGSVESNSAIKGRGEAVFCG